MPFIQSSELINNRWIYRWLLMVATVIGIGMPLFEGFYIYPHFLDWLVNSTEEDASRIGRHLAGTLSLDESLTSHSIPSAFKVEVDEVIRDLQIEKLKLFASSGEVVYSTEQKEVGTLNEATYFHNEVARGSLFTKVVKKNDKTMEGLTVTRDVVETYVPIMHDGKFVGALEIYYDITEKKSSLETLRNSTFRNNVIVSLSLMLSILLTLFIVSRFKRDSEQAEQRYHSIVDTFGKNGDGICIIDSDFKPHYMNEVMVEQFGDYEGLLCYKAIFNRDTPCSECQLPAILQNSETVKYRRAVDGRFYDVVAAPIQNRDGSIHGMAVYRDTTEQRLAEERLLHQANFDSLTNLPNRQLAEDRLSQALKSAHRNGNKAVLMFIDLDDFKKVNDTLGHDIGDQLLIKVSERLQSAVREDDTVARYGGDEFLIVVGNLEQSVDAEPIAEKILEAFAGPFEIDDETLIITTSIGLSVYPDDGVDTLVLLKNADTAMYRAKESGRNTFSFFTPSMNAEILRRLQIEKCLHGAEERGELSLHYQPLADANTLDWVGAEALIRWNSEELGQVPPDSFIYLAEQNGLIEPIGEWVLREAASQLAACRDMGHRDFFIAVNVSPRQFRSGNLHKVVAEILRERDLPQGSLKIEVTEGLLMKAREETHEQLDQLCKMGVTFSLDDFGTGYSSLQYLQQFPFKVLKIDRSFIHDLQENEKNRAVVRATIAMAHELGLTVVAEGVETRDQLEFLRGSGCNLIQGWYIERALPSDDFVLSLQQ